ncbi:MAG: ribosome-binding factor A, partial [Planctomycetota bacterium]
DVRVSADLRHATVRVSVYPEEEETLTMHGLRSAARHIQHAISDKLDLRRTPELRFELDRGLKAQAAVLQALAQEKQRASSQTDEAPSSTTDNPEGARQA